MYRIRFLEDAERGLEQLDNSVSVRILRKLAWLAANAESVQEEGLRGPMSGLSKMREGDYRIVYEFLHSENTLVVHSVGHRSVIYKR